MPTIRYDLVGDTSQFVSGMSGATSALGGVAAAALSAGAATKTLLDERFGRVQHVERFSRATGLARDTVAGLEVAARRANLELGDFDGLDSLADRMVEAARGNQEWIEIWDELGVKATEADGSLRSVDAVFRDVIDSLGQMEDEGRRAGLATQLLSTEGKALLSTLDSSDALDRYVDLVRQFGTDVGPAAVKAAEDWWAATSNLDLALDYAGNTLTSNLGPAATEMINSFSVGFVYLTKLVDGFFFAFEMRMKGVSKAWLQLSRGDIAGAVDAIDGFLFSFDFITEAHKDAFDAAFDFWDGAIREGAEAVKPAVKDAVGWVDFLAEKELEAADAVDEKREEVYDAEYNRRRILGDVTLANIRAEADAMGEWVDAQVEAFEERWELWEEDQQRQQQMREEQAEAARLLVDETIGVFATISGELLNVHQRNVDGLKDERSELRAFLREHEDAHGKRVKMAKARMEILGEELQQQRSAARRAFALSQTAALGEVLMNGAMMYSALAAAFAPLLLAGAPMAAAAIAGPMTMAQAAVVASQSPPAHMGRVLGADEIQVGGIPMQAGEMVGVLSRRATESGGAEVIDALNRDRRPPMEQRLVLGDAGRVIGEAVLREIDRGGPIAQAFGSVPSGIIDPYGGR